MDIIEKFKNELRLRKYSFNTVKTYSDNLGVVFKNIGTNPDIDSIKKFLLTINNSNYHKQIVATIHRYFEFVLKKPLSIDDIPYPRKTYKLPEVLSQEEVSKIIKIPKNRKHQAIIMLLYGCGLRVSELINLKLSDIDSKRMVINIRQSKGNKDRVIMLDGSLLEMLREYFKEYKPVTYLFNGQKKDQYTDRSVNELLKYWAKKAGINKRIYAHLLRHSFATHLVEQGTDMSIIQKLLGHENIKTTERYAQVSTKTISKVKSPLASVL